MFSPAGKKKILYVEDDVCMQNIVAAILDSTGAYELLLSNSGLDALDALPRFNPDLILLDVMMPGLAGTHTLHVIRAMPEYQNVPVVFVTSKTGPEDLATYEKLGAAAIIGKPFQPEVLLHTVQRLCGQNRTSATAH
jgi:CheY-like chemotaxis protein